MLKCSATSARIPAAGPLPRKTRKATIEQQVPADLAIHLVLDNYSTHKAPTVKRWLAQHPRYHLHFTPTSSSWLNQADTWLRCSPNGDCGVACIAASPELEAALLDYCRTE